MNAAKPPRGNVVKLRSEVPEELALLRRVQRLFGRHGPKAARGRRKSGPLAG